MTEAGAKDQAARTAAALCNDGAVGAVVARLKDLAFDPRARKWLLAMAYVLTVVAVYLPYFRDPTAMGFQDWDYHAGHGRAAIESLVRYHEMPWWNPWVCGGFPEWGYVEGATNVVSPWLPLWLTLTPSMALRIQAVTATLVGGFGAYRLASRFTRLTVLRWALPILFTLNGRWTLQISAGHVWHLVYAWLPFVFCFFEDALAPRRLVRAVYAGAIIALMVYLGGLYPLPHTAVLLTLYALTRALFDRSTRPLKALAVAGFSAIGLSAAKLFPVLDTFGRVPRVIPSVETLGLEDFLTMLLGRSQSFGNFPRLHIAFDWVWCEWGIYVGGIGVGILLLGMVGMVSRRARAFRVAGLFCFVLGFGAFHRDAPWVLLHRLPFFSSQHVPSRWFLPGLLMLGVACVAVASKPLARWAEHRAWVLPIGWVILGVFALDLAVVSRTITEVPFALVPPWVERSAVFHHSRRPIAAYVRPHESNSRILAAMNWPAESTLLPVLANVGSTECYGVPLGTPIGAIPSNAPKYRGQAFFLGGAGNARVTTFTPNHAAVQFEGANRGDVLVYDMNFDPNWRANEKATFNVSKLVATRVDASEGEMVFSYRPRTFAAGLAVTLATLLASLVVVFGGRAFARKKRRGLPSEPKRHRPAASAIANEG